jgi:hypothetical protein
MHGLLRFVLRVGESGLLYIFLADGTRSGCTGAMISIDIVVAAGHCLYGLNGFDLRFPKAMYFLPGLIHLDHVNSAVGIYKVVTWNIFDQQTTTTIGCS